VSGEIDDDGRQENEDDDNPEIFYPGRGERTAENIFENHIQQTDVDTYPEKRQGQQIVKLASRGQEDQES